MKKIRKLLISVAKIISDWAGSPFSLVAAMGGILIWAATGPLMEFNDTWQLIINTTTTITTFILALSILYTQNRDSRALHLKLNKLIAQNEDVQETLAQIEQELDDDDEQGN